MLSVVIYLQVRGTSCLLSGKMLLKSTSHLSSVFKTATYKSRAYLSSVEIVKMLRISEVQVFPLLSLWKHYPQVKGTSFLSDIYKSTTQNSRTFLQNVTPKSEADLSPLVSPKVLFLCKSRASLIGHYLSTVHATGKSKRKVIQTLASHLVRSLFFIICCFWFMVVEWKAIWASWGKSKATRKKRDEKKLKEKKLTMVHGKQMNDKMEYLLVADFVLKRNFLQKHWFYWQNQSYI